MQILVGQDTPDYCASRVINYRIIAGTLRTTMIMGIFEGRNLESHDSSTTPQL